MPDLLTRFKFHPNENELSGLSQSLVSKAAGDRMGSGSEWFYLLNAPPQGLPEAGKTRVFESALHASDWVNSRFKGSFFEQGMALSFSLPFPDQQSSQRNHQLSCVPPDSIGIQKYIDFMVKEIQLLASTLASGVRVPYLHWYGDIVNKLTPSELTQLMFHVDRSFKILSEHQSRLVFELNNAPESTDRIALLAGLGFNTVCLNGPASYKQPIINTGLLDWIEEIRPFRIGQIYVGINARSGDESLLQLIASLIQWKVAGVLINPAPDQSQNEAEATLRHIRQRLTIAGYHRVRHNFFVRSYASEHEVTHCMKGMGLGAVSYTEKFQFCNTTTLDDYYSRLEHNQLPIQSVTELHSEIC